MKNYIKYLWLLLISLSFASCENYYKSLLSQETTLEDLFATEDGAEAVLNSVYYTLPYIHPHSTSTAEGSGVKQTGWMQHPLAVIGDEMTAGRQTASNQNMYQLKSVSASQWNTDWAAGYESRYIEDLMTGRYFYIRRANFFIENIGLLKDASDGFVTESIAQAKFLQAFCYVELMIRYGSMPIVTDVTNPSGDALVTIGTRPALKDYVAYVDELIQYAIEYLPESYSDSADLGRVPRGAAYVLRARLWLYAASPLFNKRDAADYAEVMPDDGDGHEGRIEVNYDTSGYVDLWPTVATYAKEAIDYCHGFGHAIVYTAPAVTGYPNTYQLAFDPESEEDGTGGYFPGYSNVYSKAGEGDVSYQQAHDAYRFACEKLPTNGNTECIFFTRRAASFACTATCYHSRQRPTGVIATTGSPGAGLGPSPFQNAVNLYRKADGTMFTEDRGDMNDDLKKHYAENAKPWDIYEPRLNATICFDKQMVYSHTEGYDRTPFTCYNHIGYDLSGATAWSTGYGMRKYFPDSFLSFTSAALAGGSMDLIDMNMRLPELYFIYAEALNEQGQTAAALEWIKPTMRRGGLPVDTMTFPTDYDTAKEWIIREKGVEMYAEYKSLFDHKRWLLGDRLAQTKYGVVRGDAFAALYEEQKAEYDLSYPDAEYAIIECDYWHQWNDRTFDKKQYLWPIIELEILKECGWTQNPGYTVTVE